MPGRGLVGLRSTCISSDNLGWEKFPASEDRPGGGQLAHRPTTITRPAMQSKATGTAGVYRKIAARVVMAWSFLKSRRIASQCPIPAVLGTVRGSPSPGTVPFHEFPDVFGGLLVRRGASAPVNTEQLQRLSVRQVELHRGDRARVEELQLAWLA